jgi:hypothetical protein
MSIRERKQRGDDGLGSLPYGKKYQRRPDSRLKVVNDASAQEIIREICQSKRDYGTVAAILNRRGVKKRGRKWTPGMVKSTKEQHQKKRRAPRRR